MKTALTLFLLLMTTTGCALPLKLLQALLPAPKPVPDATPYPKTILRDIVPGQKIDWVGNDTVVFVGYPVNTQGKSWLYSWDMKTAPKQLLEGARSFCVNGDRISTSISPKEGKTTAFGQISRPNQLFRDHETKTGSPPISYKSEYTCEIQPTPEKLIGHFWKELRNQAGYIDFGPLDKMRKGYSVTILNKNLTKRNDTGIRIDLPTLLHISDWHPQPGYLIYDINLSPEERKTWMRTNSLTIWHLDTQLRGHVINVPAGPWLNMRRGDILFLKARGGLVIASAGMDRNGEPGNAGVYLVKSNGRYERLETGFASELALSADGCRLAYAFERYLDQRSMPHEGGRILVAMNLCAKQSGH